MIVPKTKEDHYGQQHPIESASLIEFKLVELEGELEKIPEKKKSAYLQAMDRCPELVQKLQFLRCEVFNSDLAATRLVEYWQQRVDIFGSEKAFLPLTLDQALQDDRVALDRGLIRLLPVKADPSGRNLLFIDPSRQDSSKYTRESMVRAAWYVIHSALEDEESQRKGLLFVSFPKNTKFSQFDRTLARHIHTSVRGCFPVRVAAIHICHPPTFFRIVFPIVKVFLGERLRRRIQIHAGSDANALKSLSKAGLDQKNLPTELGGAIALDHEGWLADRQADGK